MASGEGFSSQDFDVDDYDLDSRQREVLGTMSQDSDAVYSFQGLRRKLGYHQEMLSRTLDRLEEQDLVQHTTDGYRLSTRTGFGQLGFETSTRTFEANVVTAYLPARVDFTVVLGKLRGKWFKEFRWLGYSQTRGGLTLNWITDDGQIQLRARIQNQTLVVSAIFSRDEDHERATKSAFDLFDFVSRASGEVQQPEKAPILN
jgi:hypothetical protein